MLGRPAVAPDELAHTGTGVSGKVALGIVLVAVGGLLTLFHLVLARAGRNREH